MNEELPELDENYLIMHGGIQTNYDEEKNEHKARIETTNVIGQVTKYEVIVPLTQEG